MLEKRWNLFSLDTLIQYEAEGKSISDIVAANGRHPLVFIPQSFGKLQNETDT